MNLNSKYKVLYEVVKDGVRKLYVSTDAAASQDDAEVDVEAYRQYKLFFEKNDKIYARKADGSDIEVELVADDTNIFTGEDATFDVVAEDANVNLFGKLVSELQSDIVINDGVASGILNYVSGYTEFSSKVAEQEGNYIALKVVGVEASDIVTYKAKGAKKSVTLDADRNIVVIVNNHDAVLTFKVTRDGKEVGFKEISLSGVTLAEKDGE